MYGRDLGLLRSRNGGVDWEPAFPPGSGMLPPVEYNFFQSLSMDPTDHNHMIITFHVGCGEGPGCLSETYDGGETWRTVRAPYDGWSEAAGPLIIAGSHIVVHTLLDGVFYTLDGGSSWHETPGFDASAFQAYRAADGYLYLGGQRGFHRSMNGIEWESTPGPNGWGLVGDGVHMFTAVRWGGGRFFSRLETGGEWTEITSPVPTDPHEALGLAYDYDHHVLYAAHAQDGLFRMVTR